MDNLTIYKASAGSGKTFALTREFLRLLFKKPDKYRSILAVTFTNKATAEMKSRIINELAVLSAGKASPYLKMIQDENPLYSEQKIRKQAKTILESILQDYSHFSVTTIDKFNQKVIRSFVREIGVNTNYIVELENDDVLDRAIENLFFNLEDEKGDEIVKWLTRFTNDQVINGDSWRIGDKIKQLGKELFKEQFKVNEKNLLDQLTDKALLTEMEISLNASIRKIENTLRAFGNKAVKLIQDNDLELADFKFKTSSGINYFFKLSNKEYENYKIRFETLCSEDEAWSGNTPNAATVEELRDRHLKFLANETKDYVDKNLPIYLSLIQIKKNFYNLGILADIELAIRDHINDKNLLLLSDSNELIATIINDNDAPFIYEKTGSRFEHYMIDEFQDTSGLQWRNFKPLIDNSLAEAHKNLLVGDVKQSIYRFRNSDWSLLAGGINKDFRPDQIKEEVLPVNWRSSKNVVSFNNSFFSIAAHVLQKTYNSEYKVSEGIYNKLMEEAYSTVCQQLPDHRKESGHIGIKLYDRKDEDWKELTFQRIIHTIEEAQEIGYKAKDIAILVRRNTEGKEIADFLLAWQQGENAKSNINYNVLSDEALMLSASKAIRFIVNMIKRVFQNDHAIIDVELHQYIACEYLQLNEPSFRTGIFHHPTGKELIEKAMLEISYLPLLEQIDQLIKQFDIQNKPQESAYIQAFTDIAAEFTKKNYSDSMAFISWWEQKGYKRSVPSTKGQDAIQILTIHKSKGLEFPIVIVPFFDWKFNVEATKAPIAWVDTQDLIPSGTSLMPVKCSSGLQDTIFKEVFHKEQFLSFMDNLNLAYVAFTRAVEGLYIYGRKGSQFDAATILQMCIDSNFDYESIKHSPSVQLSDYWDESEQCFEYGELPLPTHNDDQSGPGLFKHGFISTSSENKLYLKLKAPKAFSQASHNILSKAEIGIVLHDVLRQLNAPEELDELLVKTRIEGRLSDEIINKVKIPLGEFLKKEQVKSWFNKDLKVYNESAIMTPESKEYRPDRVIDDGKTIKVIDYKFGSHRFQKHQRQVKQYMRLLQQMGHANIEGYLWYVSLADVVKVDLQPQQGRLF